MKHHYQHLIKKAYKAFNERKLNEVLSLMHADIHWPNGWEGGFVDGHEQLRDYWTRQWRELDPNVDPVSFTEKEDGRLEVTVHQVVKDMKGSLLLDGIIQHIYTFENNLIKSMEIQMP